MCPTQSNKLYCSECRCPTSITKHREEAYPGQYFTVFTSWCCDSEIIGQFGKPYLHGELLNLYEEQLYDEADLDD